MPTLTSQQLTSLGDSFLAFAQAVGNFRMENRSSLSKSENKKIKDLHWELLEYADMFYTNSAKAVLNDVENALKQVRNVTGQINKTYQRLESFQKAIDIASAGISLAAAIFKKDPLAADKALTELTKNWKSRHL